MFCIDEKSLVFYLRPCKQKANICQLVKSHGGVMTGEAWRSDYTLYVPGDIISMKQAVSIEFVEDCVKEGQLLDVEPYRYVHRYNKTSKATSKKADDDISEFDDDEDSLYEVPVHAFNGKREYSTEEDRTIIYHVLKSCKYYSINGNKLWDIMSANKVLDRSSQSMKERFVKKILPFIGRYNLSDAEKKKISKLSSTKARREAGLHQGKKPKLRFTDALSSSDDDSPPQDVPNRRVLLKKGTCDHDISSTIDGSPKDSETTGTKNNKKILRPSARGPVSCTYQAPAESVSEESDIFNESHNDECDNHRMKPESLELLPSLDLAEHEPVRVHRSYDCASAASRPQEPTSKRLCTSAVSNSSPPSADVPDQQANMKQNNSIPESQQSLGPWSDLESDCCHSQAELLTPNIYHNSSNDSTCTPPQYQLDHSEPPPAPQCKTNLKNALFGVPPDEHHDASATSESTVYLNAQLPCPRKNCLKVGCIPSKIPRKNREQVDKPAVVKTASQLQPNQTCTTSHTANELPSSPVLSESSFKSAQSPPQSQYFDCSSQPSGEPITTERDCPKEQIMTISNAGDKELPKQNDNVANNSKCIQTDNDQTMFDVWCRTRMNRSRNGKGSGSVSKDAVKATQ